MGRYGNRHFDQFEGGRLYMNGGQCAKLQEVLEADTAFLKSRKISDYSLALLVAFKRPPRSHWCGSFSEPHCVEDSKRVYALSLGGYLSEPSVSRRISALWRRRYAAYAQSMMDLVRQICPLPPMSNTTARLKIARASTGAP